LSKAEAGRGRMEEPVHKQHERASRKLRKT
jgi:hypothetical protein